MCFIEVGLRCIWFSNLFCCLMVISVLCNCLVLCGLFLVKVVCLVVLILCFVVFSRLVRCVMIFLVRLRNSLFVFVYLVLLCLVWVGKVLKGFGVWWCMLMSWLGDRMKVIGLVIEMLLVLLFGMMIVM